MAHFLVGYFVFCLKSTPFPLPSFWVVVMDLLKQYCLLAVPHFEKMLYDQGQIASLYLNSFPITTDVFYSCVSWDIFDYLRREVIGQEGEMFSAEGADSADYEGASRKKEGAFFYVWTSKEVCFSSPSS